MTKKVALYYKTGHLLKDAKFISKFLTGQDKGDLLIQVTA